MEYEDQEAQGSSVSLSFPVGLVLLLTFLFCMCCFFSCCLHWEKLRSLLGCPDHHHHHRHPPPVSSESPDFSVEKIVPFHSIWKQDQTQSLPVLMPGEQIPRFIAMACPCEPSKTTAASFVDKISVVVQKSPHDSDSSGNL